MYVIKEPKEYSFDKIGHKGKRFPTENLIRSTHFVISETENGLESTLVQRNSDFVYYILEGNGYFIVNGEKEECSKGDLVVIPKGTKYTFRGKLKVLLSSTPPWTPEQEETVED